MSAPRDEFAATIAHHSKSFALAAKLLPPAVRSQALVLYAYCRRADDAVDLAPLAEQPAALRALHDELDAIYEGAAISDPVARAFAAVVRQTGIPRELPQDLLAGMEMDVVGTRYVGWDELVRYCHCVAGTVGLMMCHVMGVRDARALRHADDLGIAMQLTNICRDVLEDWARGRLYLPAEVLRAHGTVDLDPTAGTPLQRASEVALKASIRALLDRAEIYYASGDAGLRYLAPRCRVAIRAARLIYSSIGDTLRDRDCDPWRGRAVVPRTKKAALALRATYETLWQAPSLALDGGI